ncbi:MAG: ribonuclease P protein subunit [Candidatus Woesearchaeota archaeon]
MKEKIYGKLIGKEIIIKEAKNKTLIGAEGKVIDETKNTIKILKDKKEKTIIKNQILKLEIK